MTQIVVNLENVFTPGASRLANARSLRNLLEYMTHENMGYLSDHPETPSLFSSGVVYARTVWWENLPAAYKRKEADCKTLTPILGAQYRMKKVWCRPVFRFLQKPDGQLLFHILLETRSGWDDPSAKLGMGADEVRQFFGPTSYGDFVNQSMVYR